jgi:ArsR family transcriptional regulator
MAKWRNEDVTLEGLAGAYAALGDETRLRLLAACRVERCVCQLVELIALAPSTISKHLAVMRRAGLLEARREGRWMHYRVPSAPGAGVAGLLGAALDAMEGSEVVRADAARLADIDRIDPEALCRLQRAGKSLVDVGCCDADESGVMKEGVR